MTVVHTARTSLPRALVVCILAFALLVFTACAEERGVTRAELARIVHEDDLTALMGIPLSAIRTTARESPETLYYLARWIEEHAPVPATGNAAATPPPKPEALLAEEPRGEGGQPAVFERLGAPSESRMPAEPTGSDLEPRARALEFLRLAFENASGTVKREAGRALVARLSERMAASDLPEALLRARSEELLAASAAYTEALGADYLVERPRLEALVMLARHAELLREVEELRAAFPAEGARDADALSYYEGLASLALDRRAWALPFRALLLERSASVWTGRALKLARANSEAFSHAFNPAELSAAELREAVRVRDYGAAYRALARCRDYILTPSTPSHLVADAGKAYLYSASAKEGLARFESAFGTPGEGADAATLWVAAFYRARFLRALERWSEAAVAFEALAPRAPSAEDRDAALYYLVDCKRRRAELDAAAAAKAAERLPSNTRTIAAREREAELRRKSLAALAEAAAQWHDPSIFADLADRALREAIAARDWMLVVDFAERLASRLTPTLGARVAYIAARALELGLVQDVPAAGKGAPGAERASAERASAERASAERAKDLYRLVRDRTDASLYYRILASHRLGEDSTRIPPARSGERERAAQRSAVEVFLDGFFEFGLADLVYAETKSRTSELDREALRRLAQRLSEAGRHADSMRTILLLQERPDWDPQRSDFELLYPRPFLSEYRAIKPRPELPEYIFYGLLRSESFFRPEVESRAGAIGLAQLMPATAAEIARKLSMPSYDLTRPTDNMRLGAAHFAELLDETGGHPLQAMFAYNAGRGRLKRWLKDLGELPDDLLLEALTIEETRQYGRNILMAGVFYGELYYGMSARDAVEGMRGEAKGRR